MSRIGMHNRVMDDPSSTTAPAGTPAPAPAKASHAGLFADLLGSAFFASLLTDDRKDNMCKNLHQVKCPKDGSMHATVWTDPVTGQQMVTGHDNLAQDVMCGIKTKFCSAHDDKGDK